TSSINLGRAPAGRTRPRPRDSPSCPTAHTGDTRRTSAPQLRGSGAPEWRNVMNRFRVEPLPARPNLEQQQKLAKRLLREAWNGDAEALERIQAFVPAATDPEELKLHDAQMAIARSYGFQTWAAMKHKIESLTQTPAEKFEA